MAHNIEKINAHLPGILTIIEQHTESKKVELESCQIADQKVSISASVNDGIAKAAIMKEVITFFNDAANKKSSAKKSGSKTKSQGFLKNLRGKS